MQERSVCDVVDASESLRRESMVVEALPHDKARMLRSISSIRVMPSIMHDLIRAGVVCGVVAMFDVL